MRYVHTYVQENWNSIMSDAWIKNVWKSGHITANMVKDIDGNSKL